MKYIDLNFYIYYFFLLLARMYMCYVFICYLIHSSSSLSTMMQLNIAAVTAVYEILKCPGLLDGTI